MNTERFYLKGVEIPFEPSIPDYQERVKQCDESINAGYKHIGKIRSNKGSQIQYCTNCQRPLEEKLK